MPRCASLFTRSCLLMVFVAVAIYSAQAQYDLAIYNFTGGSDGSAPAAGVVMDRAGNVYGTTYGGGDPPCSGGCGVVYKLSKHGTSWTFSTLYRFRSGADGANPMARVIIGPDGALYGTTLNGGNGHGTVFRLQPPAHFCGSISCPWTETVLYSFKGSSDGGAPLQGDLLFDSTGNIYGTTSEGGSTGCGGFGCGTVYKLTPANGGWKESVVYSFQQPTNSDGAYPAGGLTFDQAGNLYGTTAFGGLYGTDNCSHVTYIIGCGVVFELTPSNQGWTETVLYNFTGSADGGEPECTLLFGRSGQLYGTTQVGGDGKYDAGSGTVFQLAPSDGTWSLTTLESFLGPGTGGPNGGVIQDSSGNLYGATPAALYNGGNDLLGAIFQLTPSGDSWTYNQLYGFANYDNGVYGYEPASQVVMDSAGGLYGTAQIGLYGAGIVWLYPVQ